MNEFTDTGLKVALFRLVPGEAIEKNLIDSIRRRVGIQNLCAFRSLGHYDLLVIYPDDQESEMLRAGVIKGIRSYVSIDCITWKDRGRHIDHSSDIIAQLNNKRTLSMIVGATDIHRSSDKPNFFRNDVIVEALSNDSHYLNTFGLHDSLLLLADDTMQGLWKKTEKLTSIISNVFYDTQSILCVNPQPTGEDVQDWVEEIPEDIVVDWRVRNCDCDKAIKLVKKRQDEHNIQCSGGHVDYERSKVVFRDIKGSWPDLVEFTMSVRNSGSSIFNSTELACSKRFPVDKDDDRIEKATLPSTVPEDSFSALQEDCKAWLEDETLDGSAVAYTIQALHTVTNAMNGIRSRIAMGSLANTAKNLKLYLKMDTSDVAAIDRPDGMARLESEKLIRGVRQRLGGLKLTPRYHYIPFDQPPTNVRLYYEACEHVTDALFKLFSSTLNGLAKPSVLVDNAVNPEHSGLTITIPDLRLSDDDKSYFVYTALSHETIHSIPYRFTTESVRLRESDAVRSFVTKGQTYSYRTDISARSKLVGDILVEILDFEFVYLSNMDSYTTVSWNYFYTFLGGDRWTRKSSRDQNEYILRTFIVRLWNDIRTKATESASMTSVQGGIQKMKAPVVESFLNSSHVLRGKIREHLEEVYAVFNRVSPGGSNGRISDLLKFDLLNRAQRIQVEIVGMKEVLSDIIQEAWMIFTKLYDDLEKMKNWAEGDDCKAIVEKLWRGKPVREKMEYPFVLAPKLSRRLIDKNALIENPGDGESGKEAAGENDFNYVQMTKAYLVSLWDSKTQMSEESELH